MFYRELTRDFTELLFIRSSIISAKQATFVLFLNRLKNGLHRFTRFYEDARHELATKNDLGFDRGGGNAQCNAMQSFANDCIASFASFRNHNF